MVFFSQEAISADWGSSGTKSPITDLWHCVGIPQQKAQRSIQLLSESDSIGEGIKRNLQMLHPESAIIFASWPIKFSIDAKNLSLLKPNEGRTWLSRGQQPRLIVSGPVLGTLQATLEVLVNCDLETINPTLCDCSSRGWDLTCYTVLTGITK